MSFNTRKNILETRAWFKLQPHRGLGVGDIASVVMTVAAVMLSGSGAAGDPDMFMTKLPMPIQKAMARPVNRPTTAP